MFSQIRRTQKYAGLPLVAQCVFVPLSWPLTAGADALGLSANTVTAIRAVLIGLGIVAIPFTLWGLVPFMLAVVLDHTDGGICRLHGTATHFGKYIDGLVDIAGDLMFLPALGLYVMLHGGPEWALPVSTISGAALGIMFIALYRLPLFELASKLSAQHKSRFLALVDSHGANAVFNIRYALLPVGIFFPAPYLAAMGVVCVVACALVIVSRTRRAYLGLNVLKYPKVESR